MTSLHKTVWLQRSKAQIGSHKDEKPKNTHGYKPPHTEDLIPYSYRLKHKHRIMQQNNTVPVLWVFLARQQARPVLWVCVCVCEIVPLTPQPPLSCPTTPLSLPDMLWWRDKLKVILREQRLRSGMCGITLSCSVDKKHIRGWYGVIWACVITAVNVSRGLMAWFRRARWVTAAPNNPNFLWLFSFIMWTILENEVRWD